jgi:hypothetical protein
MFEGNILTFNPGWDENAKNIEIFDDIREIQRRLKNNGLSLTSEADETAVVSTIKRRYRHCEHREAIHDPVSPDCFVVPPRNDDIHDRHCETPKKDSNSSK